MDGWVDVGVNPRVSQKTLVLNFASSVESLVPMGVQRPQKLAHICRIWSDGHMAINGHMGHMGHIWPYGHRTICKKIWASEVSLERAIKM